MTPKPSNLMTDGKRLTPGTRRSKSKDSRGNMKVIAEFKEPPPF